MNSTAPQPYAPFTFTLDYQRRDPYGLQVLGFTGTEQISRPFSFDVSLVSEQSHLPLEDILHRMAFLALNNTGAGIWGQIYRVTRGESGKRLTHYRATLVPRLHYLRHRINTRIFQHMSVPQIIDQVMKENAFFATEYCFALDQNAYPPRTYCTQYNESDLQLLQRLCAQEGIHFHFRHEPSGPMTVFGDNDGHFTQGVNGLYCKDAGLVEAHPTVTRFDTSLQAATHRTLRQDYNFKTPSVRYDVSHTITEGVAQPLPEDYQWPGHASDDPRAEKLVRIAAERNTWDQYSASGASHLPQLLSGHFLALTEHPDEGCNIPWLLTSINHEGWQPQVLEEQAEDLPKGAQQGYRNHFSAVPCKTPFRPPLEATPHIRGSEPAVVTGPPGKDVFCDEHGRVKVQFFWDRDGQGDQHSSCWLRVASSWAGDRYGSMVIPRVGMEVLVSFMRGDPDQPYVSGCLVHADNRPPYALPEHSTRSVFKSASLPGAGGANELYIEDRQGQEEIYLHAQRDLTQHVQNTHRLHVGGERHDSVGGNSLTEIKAEEHRITHADRKVTLNANDHLQVAMSQHTRIGGGQFVEAGQELHFKAAGQVVIEAGTALTLSAGGHFLTLNPSGIWHNGQLLLGGSPAIGSGVQLLNALAPGGVAGTEPVAVPHPIRSAAERGLLRTSQEGYSRCLVCEACREQAQKAAGPAQ